MQTSAPVLGEPAPVELMNTVWADRSGVHDALGTDAAVAAWLADALGLADVDVPPLLAGRIRRLRAALRTLAAEVTGDRRPRSPGTAMSVPQAVEVLNGTSALAPGWTELRWADPPVPVRCTARTGVPAALSAIADEAARLLAGGRLRACGAPGCVLYFVPDHPRRQWCTPACGNRARAARHYARHRRASAARAGGPAPRDSGATVEA